jgi:predicted secreted protein
MKMTRDICSRLGRALAIPFILAASIAAAHAADVTVSEADNGKTISVPLHSDLIVNLPGKHNSGRYWRLDADLTPELILAGRSTSSVTVDGAPETTTFVFSADAPGTLQWRATYAQPGTPRADTSDIAFTVTVTSP